jgi:hypothetical protein
MAFEVALRSLGRSRRPIVVPPLIAAAVIAIAILGGRPGPAPPPAVSPQPPVLADVTECVDVRPVTCRQAAEVAAVALGVGHPTIASAKVWRSLLCGDTLDCSPTLLLRTRPAGSVVFTFDDRTVAWVNLVWVDVSSRRFEDGTERLTAFVVRWFGVS